MGLLQAPLAKAQVLTTLYTFCSQGGNCTDGNDPTAALVQGADGNFYGTASQGGHYTHAGTVFKITPDGVLTTLYLFCSQSGCTDGSAPMGGVVQGSDGSLYGTTQFGGANNEGTVFKIAPDGSNFTTLYSFCSQSNCTDGSQPYAGLVQGSDGNFYGTTSSGEAGAGPGTIFKITPGGALTTLYTFCSQTGCVDGYFSTAGLVQGSDGNFYGTTHAGGANGAYYGTVFKVTSGGTLTTLYSFCSLSGCTDGENPAEALVEGSDGNFYGTTEGGGASNAGTVFKITPGGTVATLYSFCSQGRCADGENPRTALLQGGDGNFYGTTEFGGAGAYCVPAYGCGTVFKITPGGALTTVYSFCSQYGCPDGVDPQAGLEQGSDGYFYGTTSGTVYRLNPVASVSPMSLTFGSQDLGTTSQAQQVTLTNPGVGVLAISGIGLGGANPGDFGETNNCIPPASLAPGASCTINVTFSPTAIGTRSATLIITDNSGGVPNTQQNVSLMGTGINPGATLSPTSLSFASQVINTPSVMRKATLASTGTTPLIISNTPRITFNGLYPADFAETDNCPLVMPPGTHCTIKVTFTPSILGHETSTTLDVYDNAANSPQPVDVSGTGIPPVTLTPATVKFGDVGVGTPSAVMTLVLTNNQAVKLNVSSISPGNPDFVETDNCTPQVLAKHHCDINVTFTPSTLTLESTTLTVNEDAPAPYSSLGSTLSGTGVADVTLTPATYKFGNVGVDSPSTAATFTLKNNQAATLHISAIGYTGANPGDFAQTGGTCGTAPTTLAGGGKTCTILVTFTPSQLVPESASLVVTDDAPSPYSSLQSSLSGTGVPQATVSPTSLTFSAETVGIPSAAETVTLTNHLTTFLMNINITFSGLDPGDFSQSNLCGGSLAAKSSCKISVTFKPGATGKRTATMNVNDSANNSAQTVSLTGTGK
jgi:uncharacterized repeat protein (TIGR03803 family)